LAGAIRSYDYRVNESAVLLAGDLAWPSCVLVIAVVLLATQRKPIGGLIARIKSVKYPGGEAELSVPEADADKIQAAVDTLSRDPLTERVDRQDLAQPAAEADDKSMQNREPVAAPTPLPSEKVTNLVMLRTKAANLLYELAVPPPPGGFGSVSATIDTLVKRGVLDDKQAKALRGLVDIADLAARGAVVPERVEEAAENSGPAILEQLALRRTEAAARFEDYVLDTLQDTAPREWSIDIDRAIVSEHLDATDQGVSSGKRPRHARVDALVTVGDREAVVEVRARLQPGASGQIQAVREWMKALPPDIPILLIMLGEGLTPREIEQMCGGHRGPVELLEWDRDADSLIRDLGELLGIRISRRPEARVLT
jgi:hypothetical protein